jgi:uncharacterized protein (TIGR03086 family)
MDVDLLDLYGRASAWTSTKVPGAVSQLDAPTTCERWNVRALLNHMLQVQRYFVGVARGDNVENSLLQDPPDLLSDDPISDFEEVRAEVLGTFGEPGVIERTGIALGAAFGDQLMHGWDLAVSTGQDPTMPEDLPEAAYAMLHGLFPEEQRKGVFNPEIRIDPESSVQLKLLAYTGRDPARGA